MLIFRNPGLIDMDAALTMGVSVKDGEQPIGYFGTGLKFSIATILRSGGSITLYRGSERHEFTLQRKIIRGQEFDLVCMDGESLGFTSQLGRDWKPWMAWRELASNCSDEGGSYLLAESDEICEKHLDGHTTIIVRGLDQIWPERHSILLESTPLAKTDHADIHPGASPYVFYRGVRIYNAPRPLLFTYNIKSHLELTEDRQAASWWSVEVAIERAIGELDDPKIMRQILTAGEQVHEHYLDVPRFGSPGATFKEAARQVAMSKEHTTGNPKAIQFARASAVEDMQPGDSIELGEAELVMLQRAKWLLKSAAIDVEQFPVIICETLGPSIHGLARDGKIFLTRKAFDKGTRELAATIFEEWAHLVSGAGDATIALQNFLIDRVLIQIETSEGEPF